MNFADPIRYNFNFEIDGYRYFSKPNVDDHLGEFLLHMIVTPDGKRLNIKWSYKNLMTEDDLKLWLKVGRPLKTDDRTCEKNRFTSTDLMWILDAQEKQLPMNGIQVKQLLREFRVKIILGNCLIKLIEDLTLIEKFTFKCLPYSIESHSDAFLFGYRVNRSIATEECLYVFIGENEGRDIPEMNIEILKNDGWTIDENIRIFGKRRYYSIFNKDELAILKR
jgi:hypothetical protein